MPQYIQLITPNTTTTIITNNTSQPSTPHHTTTTNTTYPNLSLVERSPNDTHALWRRRRVTRVAPSGTPTHRRGKAAQHGAYHGAEEAGGTRLLSTAAWWSVGRRVVCLVALFLLCFTSRPRPATLSPEASVADPSPSFPSKIPYSLVLRLYPFLVSIKRFSSYQLSIFSQTILCPTAISKDS